MRPDRRRAGTVSRFRGRGIGSRLLKALVVSARAQHYEALSLGVEPDNPARRLYERCGFQVVGAVDGSLTMMLVSDAQVGDRAPASSRTSRSGSVLGSLRGRGRDVGALGRCSRCRSGGAG